MFSSVCQECGAEIPPQAKECVACNPLAASVDLMDLGPREPKHKKSKALKTEPLLPADPTTAKALLPARAASEIPAPQAPRVPMPLSLSVRTSNAAAQGTQLKTIEAEPAAVATQLPAPVSSVERGPKLAAHQDYSIVALSKLSPKAPKTELAGSQPQAHLSLPGPALPFELTSVHAAGIAKVIVSVGPWMAAPADKPKSSWFLSMVVAAGIVASVLGGLFYAMPSLAGPTQAAEPPQTAEIKPADTAKQAEPELPSDPLSKAIEVTGVRFVTGIPDRRPELHYLVVNHSNVAISGVVVQVTLRNAADASSVSQFSFRTPRLGAYESREMVSTIERMNAGNVPDWRRVEADLHIVQ